MNVFKTKTFNAAYAEGKATVTITSFDKKRTGLRLIEMKFANYTKITLVEGDGRTDNFKVVFEVIV